MDTSFIITCLIILGFLFIPFVLLVTMGKKGSKAITIKTKEVVAANSLNISKSENWGVRYAGIDTVQKKLLFIRSKQVGEQQTEELVVTIDLQTVKSCNVLEKRQAKTVSGKNETVLEKLDLEVLLKNGNNLILHFYDSRERQMENWEMQRIEKWKALITIHITNHTDTQKAA